jgi:hypothetical protein
MALETDEFIRCFLLHLLPDCFQRIRYYGFLAIRYREQKLSVGRDGNKLWSLTLQGWTGDPLWSWTMSVAGVCSNTAESRPNGRACPTSIDEFDPLAATTAVHVIHVIGLGLECRSFGYRPPQRYHRR